MYPVPRSLAEAGSDNNAADSIYENAGLSREDTEAGERIYEELVGKTVQHQNLNLAVRQTRSCCCCLNMSS